MEKRYVDLDEILLALPKSAEIIIRNWPVADVTPIIHGKWLWDEDGMDWNIGSWVCSACHSRPETLWEGTKNINPYRKSGSHYCPNCGAKMEHE